MSKPPRVDPSATFAYTALVRDYPTPAQAAQAAYMGCAQAAANMGRDMVQVEVIVRCAPAQQA